MSVGGRIIEIKRMRQHGTGSQVDRLWVVDDRLGGYTEACVYAEPFAAYDGPALGEEVWWQGDKIYFDKDSRWLTKVGYSFSPLRSLTP